MDPINACTQFLSDALNNRSAALTSQMLSVFLHKYSNLIALNESELKIKIKPLGKRCLICSNYIPISNINTSIGL